MRNTFAVGRLNGKTSELVLRTRLNDAPFPGPWNLRAVVGEAGGAGRENGRRNSTGRPQTRVLPFPGVRAESE
jgi:hypothetical protein